MITVRLYTGQVLTFPDDTPEESIHAAAQHVLSGQADREIADFSDVQTGSSSTAPTTDQQRLRKREQIRDAWKSGDLGHVPEPDTSGAAIAADALGVTGAVAANANVNTARLPSVLGGLAARGLERATQPLRDVSKTQDDVEAERRLIIARRLMDAGVDPGNGLASMELKRATDPAPGPPDPLAGPAAMAQGWQDDATQRLATSTQDLPTPVAAAINWGADTAGIAADAGQWMLGGSHAPDAATERALAAEARGGARELEGVPGLVVREYGKGSAPSEIAQAQAARSGKFLPGAKPPLLKWDPDYIYRQDPADVTSGSPLSDYRWQGQIPDKVREMAGKPWRVYGKYTNLEEPTSAAPMPRSVQRPAIDVPIKVQLGEDGSPLVPVTSDDAARINGLWDYASKRYPRISSTVSSLEIGPHSSFDPDTGVLALSPDADLGSMMHELTHAAQTARGQFDDRLPSMFRSLGWKKTEPYAVRAGEVYGRIPQPLPKPLAAPIEDITEPAAASGGGQIQGIVPLSDHEFSAAMSDPSIEPSMAGYGGESEGRAFTAWMHKNGINPDYAGRYGELPELRDKFFELHNDPGPVDNYGPLTTEEQAGIDARGVAQQSAQPVPGAPTEPFRAYAQPPPAPPPLTEDETAAAMGWKLPDGAPKAAGPPIVTPEFQTNLAAQLGADGQRTADWIVQNSDEVAKAIGPQQTWNTVEDMATRSGTTPEEFLKNNPRWNVLPPEERMRLTYVIKGNDMELQKLQAKLVDGTASDVDKAEILRRIDTASSLIKIGAKTGSEYGRALNTLKMEARLALGDDQMLKQSLYRKYAAQLDTQKPLMDSLARLDPNKPDEMASFLRSVNRPTFRQYLHEYWVNSILSSPVPFERKVIGDTIASLMENAVVRPLAAAFDAARVAGTTAEREVFMNEVPAAFTGLGRGMEQGFRRGMEVLRRGYDPETMTGELFVPRSAFARSQNQFVREVVGPVVTAPVRLISAATTMARTMNFTAELYAQAARAASKELAAGTIEKSAMAGRIATLVTTPTEEMIAAASKFGAKTTFTDETSAIGKAFIGIRDLPKATSANPVINGGYEAYRAVMGFMLPFVHIADRLLVRGLEYTPISAATAIGARNAGNYAEAAQLAAKASIGSAAMAYAASLAMQGKITASAPSDPAARAAFYHEHKQPWSVKVGDEWIPFGHMQPLAMPFALVAAIHKGWTENGDAPDGERLSQAAAQIGAHITDQSYLQSMHKLMDVVSGSEQNAGRAGSDIAASTLFGFVPFSGMVRTVARAVDPRMIDAKTIGEKMRANVPYESLGEVGKLTPWGEEDIPAGGRFRGVLASGTALLPSQEVQDPLDKELARLGVPLGFVGNTISDKQGGKIRLTADEHYVYQQSAGRATKLALQSLFATPGYMELDPEEQRTQVSKAVGAARKYARMTVLMYHRKQGYPGMDPTLGTMGAGGTP